MKKVALSLVIILLIFGSLTISVAQVAKGNNIKEKVEEKRTASLPEMNLLDYMPRNIEGFNKKESHSLDDTTGWVLWNDAESGWLTDWESSDMSYNVTSHYFYIDVCKFSTSEKASDKIINEVGGWGEEVNVETLEGFPLLIATQEQDYENSAGADAFIGYYQDEMIIYIELRKGVIEGSVSSDQLVKEGKQVFRAIIEQSKGESDKKEDWMKNSDQKDSASNSELEVLNWDVKSKKAGYPGNYRTEVWVEGIIENVGDNPAKDITIGARFTHKGQQVSVNFINYPYDELRPGVTWRFRIPCPSAEDMVDGATLLIPET